MDSNRIKRLATGVRAALRNEVSARLDSILAEGSTERLESPSRVSAIEEDLRIHSREDVVDRAAYTWFNRLCALRFMDANGYTPVPVVTPRDGQTQPAILADASQGFFDPEYDLSEGARQSIAAVLTGSKASTNAAEDAYSLLLQAICDHYANPMPYLFAEEVTSSLLMPQGLLAEGSILSRIVSEMDEDACASVEVLGWLYQFYVAERKDEVFAGYKKRRKAQAADIAPATQLFTPEWIVCYLTQNSLGRLWMLNDPESKLAESMEYYIAPEGDEPHVEVTSADEIRVLDPACGSGHILVYAFDLLFAMYEEEGWSEEDIPQMILENNLFGLEIDRRAAEIASFALEMKAREHDPRWLGKNIDAHIRVLEPIELDAQELLLVPQLAERSALLDAMAHLDQVGSLYVPDGWDEFILQNELEQVSHDGSLFANSVVDKLECMLEVVRALGQTYHCVIANPPYMGSGNMNSWLSGWVKQNYPDVKSDLCTCFIERVMRFAKAGAYASIITSDTCMYISSFEKMRKKIIDNSTIVTFIDTRGSNAHPDVFDANAGWVLQNAAHSIARGSFFKLNQAIPEKKDALIKAVHNPECGWSFRADAEDFKAIPGWPIAYWASEDVRNAFANGVALGRISKPRQGMATSDNRRFVRLWWEVNQVNSRYTCVNARQAEESGGKWFPYNKGGAYRKWYGNNDFVVNWEKNGEEILSYAASLYGSPTRTIKSINMYFRSSITWSKISSGEIAFRYKSAGHLFDVAGTSIFGEHESLKYIQGAVNSSSILRIAKILSPTLNFESGQIAQYPIVEDGLYNDTVNGLVDASRVLSRTDWDAFETSWDFNLHPLLSMLPPEAILEVSSKSEPSGEARSSERVRVPLTEGDTLLSVEYIRWETECRERFDRLKANEEELNRIFARIYHMEGEVPIEVPDDKVSVRLADRARDARSLISYAVGCMLGRYSDEVPGLVLADQGQTVADFQAKVPGATFVPDDDNVLPVLADEWFDDDVVTGFRQWLAHAFGEATLSQNVAWLEESIGRDLRSYFCRDFYADHVKVYQKRPIYWMFQSPKKSFQCLIYMHRYTESTVGTILSGYLRELQSKLKNNLSMLESHGTTAGDVKRANKIRAQIAELEDWERKVMKPLADERISIDLDDGVKVNYNKFPHALAKVPGLSEWR